MVGLSHYYAIRTPSDSFKALYNEAVGKRSAALLSTVNRQDERDAAMVIQKPWTIGYLDAFHSLIGRDSVISRLATLFAALMETQPEYVLKFTNHPISPFDAFCQLTALGVRLIWLAAIGAILVGFSRLNGG